MSLLLPRLTTAERDAIERPSGTAKEPLVIFNTTTNHVEAFNGIAWAPASYPFDLPICPDCGFRHGQLECSGPTPAADLRVVGRRIVGFTLTGPALCGELLPEVPFTREGSPIAGVVFCTQLRGLCSRHPWREPDTIATALPTSRAFGRDLDALRKLPRRETVAQARELAQTIAGDIRTRYQDSIARAQAVGTIGHALASIIEDGRQLFVSRVTPALEREGIYEYEIATLMRPAAVKGGV